MPLPSTYIGRYDWELARLATSVTASAPHSEYAAGNLIIEGAKPAMLNGTSGHFVLEYDDPIAPAFAMLAYHYLDAGLGNVKIQGHTSSDFSAPAFSATFPIPAKRLDGPSYQRWTRSPMIELGDLPDPGGYAFWRLLFGDANSQDIAVGQLLLYSQLLQVQLFHVDGSSFDESDATLEISNLTDLDVESGVYRLGGPRRKLGAYLIGTDLDAGTAPAQEAEDFRDLHEANEGRLHPFAFLPFGDFDDVWYVKPEANDLPRAHRQDGAQTFPIVYREISRGLPFQ